MQSIQRVNLLTDGDFSQEVAPREETSWNSVRTLMENDQTQSPSSILSISEYAPLFIFQVCTSLLSIGACIVVIRISTSRLDSTYQRLIFLLGVSVLLNSIFLALHPLLVPSTAGGDAYWAIGSASSCSTAGFFLVFGALVVSLYHNILAMHFDRSAYEICREFWKNHNEQSEDRQGQQPKSKEIFPCSGFHLCPEPSLFSMTLCVILPLVIASTIAGFGAYGYDAFMGLCTVYGTNEDGRQRDLLNNLFRWTLSASACVTLLTTAMTRYRVRRFRTKLMLLGNHTDVNRNHYNANDNEEGVQQELQITRQKLANMSKQSRHYTTAYLACYIWLIVLLFLDYDNASRNRTSVYAIRFLMALFYPLLGVLNCSIYVRPRLQTLEILYPQDSLFVTIRVAMSKAGDPKGIEKVRASIYGSEYSRSYGGETPAGENSEDDENDSSETITVSDEKIPRVVSFNPASPISVKSLVTVAGEDDDKNEETSIPV